MSEKNESDPAPPRQPLLQVGLEGPLPAAIADAFSLMSDFSFVRSCSSRLNELPEGQG